MIGEKEKNAKQCKKKHGWRKKKRKMENEYVRRKLFIPETRLSIT